MCWTGLLAVIMIETYKEFTFEAAHQLQPFSGLHGHSFRVRIYLQGPPDPVFGWPANLYQVEPEISTIQNMLDHKYLNDIQGLSVPSLENIAIWIWERLKQHCPELVRIMVARGADGQAEGCVYSGNRVDDGTAEGAAPPR
jgi:6-pyruvoyltetrahydropterin/6-carboxytetrahydropterin synthase